MTNLSIRSALDSSSAESLRLPNLIGDPTLGANGPSNVFNRGTFNLGTLTLGILNFGPNFGMKPLGGTTDIEIGSFPKLLWSGSLIKRNFPSLTASGIEL